VLSGATLALLLRFLHYFQSAPLWDLFLLAVWFGGLIAVLKQFEFEKGE